MGVRAKERQRLEFEYSTTATSPVRLAAERILQRNFRQIGIQLDIQNYPGNTFFGPFLTGGKASCNHTLDALYQQELATVDAGVRQQVFRQIHEIYLTEFPFIMLYSTPDPLAIAHWGTHNYLPSPFVGETVNIWEWWCDNGKC